MKKYIKQITSTFLVFSPLIFLSLIFIILTATNVDAHRCKPINCNIKFYPPGGGNFEKECLVYIPGQGFSMETCYYKIKAYECVLWCDPFDVSMVVSSDCTIDDQPPGSQSPRKYPTPCGPDQPPVSYAWQEIEFTGGLGCTSTCWEDVNGVSCDPEQDITRSAAGQEGTCVGVEP